MLNKNSTQDENITLNKNTNQEHNETQLPIIRAYNG